MAAMTMPPETWTMGREMPKKLRMVEPSSSMMPRKMMLLRAIFAGERAIDLGGRVAGEAEEDEGGAERVDEREERCEGR